MQFSCDQALLAEAINVATRALPNRTTMPILEGIYMEATQEGVTMICSDLSKGMETKLEATVTESGAAVLPGKLLAEVARKLPAGDVVVTAKGSQVTIKTAYTNMKLSCQDAQQYPPLAQVESARPIIISQPALRDMIRQTVFSVSQEDLRPALTGALLEIENSKARLVALDGFRLALRETPLGEDYGKLSAVIPGPALQDMMKTLTDNPEDKALLTLTRSHIMVDMGNSRFVSRLLDGDFIKYQQILPSEWKSRIRVATSDLSAALERVSTMARGGTNNLIYFLLKEGELQLQAESEQGQADDRVPCKLEGEELEIAFNARYMMDVMRNLGEDEMYICFNSNISPCTIRPVEGNHFLYLVLPVRIYA